MKASAVSAPFERIERRKLPNSPTCTILPERSSKLIAQFNESSIAFTSALDIAERLERNNIVVNYQATPDEEGFTASGALRMGVSEMTRFGFEAADFDRLAGLMADCILRGKDVKEDVKKLRSEHLEMRYCFDDAEIDEALEQLAAKLV